MAKASNVNSLSPETIEQVLRLEPSLRDQFISAVDAELDRLTAVRAALTGSKRSSGKRAGKSSQPKATDGRSHPDAIRHALSLKKFAEGATSRDLRDYLAANGHAMNSATLGTTLQNLKKSEEIASDGKKGSMTYSLKSK